jgi:hypothetical protein
MAFGRGLGVWVSHACVLSLSGASGCSLRCRAYRFLIQIPIRAYPASAWLRGSEPGEQPDGRLEISIKKHGLLVIAGI